MRVEKKKEEKWTNTHYINSCNFPKIHQPHTNIMCTTCEKQDHPDKLSVYKDPIN